MMTFEVPTYIERSKIRGAPLEFVWGKDQYEFGHGFSTLGDRTPIVRKLETISIRGILGLLAASSEWLVHRLAGSEDPCLAMMVAALWVGSVDPRRVNLANLPYSEGANVFGGLPGLGKTDPAKGPIRAFLGTVWQCYRIALKFDGAFHSYAESALLLVNYVMPNNAYSRWRRACYGHLAMLTSSHAMSQVHKMLLARQKECGAKYSSSIVEKLIADGALDELWGPALPRDAYNPKIEPDLRSSAELMTLFLQHANVGENPFLQ